MKLRVFSNDDDLAVQAAAHFTRSVRDALRERGRAWVAFTGGSTPKKMYEALARAGRGGQTAELLGKAEWARLFVFMSDERFVPADCPDSNFGALKDSLLEPVAAPAGNLFPVPTHLASAEAAAEAYAQTIKENLGQELARPPRFDLILLGLGEDGHTASLFPGAPSLSVTDRWVVASPPGVLPPQVERVTFTLPLLNAGREVMFLAAGRRKAQAVHDALEAALVPETTPAARVHPTSGALTWFLDEAAGSLARYTARHEIDQADSPAFMQSLGQFQRGDSNGH